MTREEARDQIVIFMADENEVINDRDRQALDTAIKALEQEPCEDAISREYMYKLGAKCIAARNENDALVAIASIESLPSVQPKTDIRECGSCKHSKDGHIAGTEECHLCMWKSQYKPKTELCDDCISRAEAIKALKELEQEDIETYGCKIPEGFDADGAIEKLRNLPSVQSKTGHWIKDGRKRNFLDTNINKGIAMKKALGIGYHTYINDVCSKCRKITIHDDSIVYDYCPHCGAKMESGGQA